MKSSKSRYLHVFDGNDKVGLLALESRESPVTFSYDPAWLARGEAAYAISPHLPMSDERAPTLAISRFLANLLPEGRALDAAANLYRLARNDIFGLIAKLGRESAGALTISESDDPLPPSEDEAVRISDEELSERIKKDSTPHFAIWHKRFCASLAGKEDKLPVRIEADAIFLADEARCSTHILKPEHQRAVGANLVANEHYCMTLAKALGLAAAAVSIRRIPEPVLVVERFDRCREGDAIRRRHIIDGCQALDLPPGFKYERVIDDAAAPEPTYTRIGVSLRGLLSCGFGEQSELARWQLVSWSLFNFVIGNSDAHGKNVSFHVSGSGLSMAPCYDLLSVAVYGEAMTGSMAMAFGDQFDASLLTARDMRALARQTGFTAEAVALEMALLSRKAVELAPALADSADYVGAERSMVREIASIVVRRARRLEEMADELMAVRLAS